MWLQYFRVRLLVIVVIAVSCSHGVSTQRPSSNHNPSTTYHQQHLHAAPLLPSIIKQQRFLHLENDSPYGNIDDADERVILSSLLMPPVESGNVLAAQEIAFKRPLMISNEDDDVLARWRQNENSAKTFRTFRHGVGGSAKQSEPNFIYNYRTTNRLNNEVDSSFPFLFSPTDENGNAEMALHSDQQEVSINPKVNDEISEAFAASSYQENANDMRKQKRLGVEGQTANRQLRYYSVDDGNAAFREPHYAYGYSSAAGYRDDNDEAMLPPRSLWHRLSSRNYKREPATSNELMQRRQTKFVPSISAGAMTHLGNFFDDLTRNIHYTEKTGVSESSKKLLEGADPMRMHKGDTVLDDGNAKTLVEGATPGAIGDKTANFLHAVRTYRPSQKIRSLVAMNPHGYHGSQFIDPNYMWVGLG